MESQRPEDRTAHQTGNPFLPPSMSDQTGSQDSGGAVIDVIELEGRANEDGNDTAYGKGRSRKTSSWQRTPKEKSTPDVGGEKDVPWTSGSPRRYTVKQDISWKNTREALDRYDEDMCAAWKDDIDQLLIFAGLFAGVVTSFSIESYQWLSKSPEDTTTELLSYIAAQLTPDGDSLPEAFLVEPFEVSPLDVYINALWFLSLALSVSTVFIGVLCLQWLREYRRDAGLSHKDAIALRQMRFEGLSYWQLPNIITFLPLLLLSSLILFFIGLLCLLWSKNVGVAAFATVVIGGALLFIAITSLLPTLQIMYSRNPRLQIPQAPFKSPLSWAVLNVGTVIAMLWGALLSLLNFGEKYLSWMSPAMLHDSWVDYDLWWRRARDAVSFRGHVPAEVRDGADLMKAVQWSGTSLNQTHDPDNLDLVYPAYSLFTADYDAKLLGEDWELDILKRLKGSETMDELVELGAHWEDSDDAGKQDLILSAFLRLHINTHPSLRAGYVEAIIRSLNTLESYNSVLCKWLGEIVVELNGNVNLLNHTLLLPQHSSRNAQVVDLSRNLWAETPTAFPHDRRLVVQLGMCVRDLLRNDNLQTKLDVGDRSIDSSAAIPWNLLDYLFNKCGDGVAGEDEEASKDPWNLILALDIIGSLEGWMVSPSEEGVMSDRFMICIEGVLGVLPLQTLMPLLSGVPGASSSSSDSDQPSVAPVPVASPDWTILVRFIRYLDEFVVGVMRVYPEFLPPQALGKWRALLGSIGSGATG
ncbi:hypothetical protein FA15DRAFT_206562 [Coprinopsis marcescibilis]|uniref:DUF6535 domain-containing protein n=1 Tax=Coprinopsis marcescibilis TaxID=230819 RepID=A0A5C3LEC3_COPMA|nr:hypothetical protein FA15DRAFT_206562 [Coprinopsis marcescibilis]